MVALLALCSWSVRAASGERWLKVAAPEFTVITTLGEKDALAWTGEFAQFVAALQDFIRVNPQRLPRLTLVVFARERDFERFHPMRENGTASEVAGYFARRPSWAVAGMGGLRMNDETRRTIFHEGTHWFTSGFELPNPMWLEEGLAEVFSTFAIEGKKLTWGRAIDSHVRVLRLIEPIPLEQLLFLSRDLLHGEGEIASLVTGISYAQSWAFVHYLIFGQREVPKGSLVDYVRRLRSAEHPDEAFKQAFGGSYADVHKKLVSYLRGGRYFVTEMPLRPLPPLKAEPASVLEVEEALARLRMAAHRYGEARGNIERAIAAAPDNPRVYELQGEFAQETDDKEAALAAYRMAIEKGSQDFKPYYEIASHEHREGSLTPEKARVVATRYERAINLNPRFREAYEGLGAVVGVVPPGNTEDAKFLELGLKLYPDAGMVKLGLATIAKREGNMERAKALVKEVLESTTGQPKHVLDYARRLDGAWIQKDIGEQVNALTKERKYTEALALIDKQLEEGVDIPTRQKLQPMRERLQVSLAMEEARTAYNARRYEEA
ncbi:MAG: DUF1570 domain-containing protein, partial [Verrucomicrobiota bacterium]